MHSQKLSLSLCVVLLVVAAGCGRKTDTGGTTGTTGTEERNLRGSNFARKLRRLMMRQR